MKDLKERISLKASELGFLDIGFSPAMELTKEAKHLENWLNDGNNGEMLYMSSHFDKRIDPRKLVDNAKTVISLSYNYYSDRDLKNDSYKVSKYAYGRDYHKVVKKKLHLLENYIRESLGDINIRSFVDSAPVMDKVWAEKSGLGWLGKNSNLINKKRGSFFFLGEIILDVDLNSFISPRTDHCGTCTRCIDYCPTNAIIEPYKVDGSKCISYLTIELKDELIPNEFKNKMDDWVFGCDVCQDVCPWNRFSTLHNEKDFEPKPELLNMSKSDWEDLNEETYEKLFNGTPLRRVKYKGLKRNIRFIKQ